MVCFTGRHYSEGPWGRGGGTLVRRRDCVEASVEGATICQRRAAALRSVSGRTGGLEREREGGRYGMERRTSVGDGRGG